jgi:hypothetical protein
VADPDSVPCHTAILAGSCLPFGPAHRGRVGMHHRGHHLQPGAHRQREQPLLHVTDQPAHRDCHRPGTTSPIAAAPFL